MVNLLELGHIVDIMDNMTSRQVVNQALSQAGLSRDLLRTGPGFVPYAPVAMMVEAAARRLGDRHLGMKIGQRFEYSAYDGYAEYVLSAPYLGAALVRARRALPLIHPGSDLILRVSDAYLTIGFAGHINTTLGYRHIEEGGVPVVAQAFRHFLGVDWHPHRIDITGPAQASTVLLEDMMHSPLRTGAPLTALIVRKADLRARNPMPELVRNAIPFADLVARMGGPAPQTVAESVRHLLRTQPQDLSQDRAADLLGMGSRTLQRSLRGEGTTFREIKRQFLAERSQALLVETPLKISEVARRLGYDEPNNFCRAFHGWTGMAPSDFRTRHFTRH